MLNFSSCPSPLSIDSDNLKSLFYLHMLPYNTVIVGILAALYTSLGIVDFAAILAAVFGTYVLYQKRVLAELGGFRSLHNLLREKINEFILENNKLSMNVEALKRSVSR